jgi:hypothetical protein
VDLLELDLAVERLVLALSTPALPIYGAAMASTVLAILVTSVLARLSTLVAVHGDFSGAIYAIAHRAFRSALGVSEYAPISPPPRPAVGPSGPIVLAPPRRRVPRRIPTRAAG